MANDGIDIEIIKEHGIQHKIYLLKIKEALYFILKKIVFFRNDERYLSSYDISKLIYSNIISIYL